MSSTTITIAASSVGTARIRLCTLAALCLWTGAQAQNFPVTLAPPTSWLLPDITGSGLTNAAFSESLSAKQGMMIAAEAPSPYNSTPARVHIFHGGLEGWVRDADFVVAPTQDWTVHALAADIRSDRAIVGIGPLQDDPYFPLNGFRIFTYSAGTWTQTASIDSIPTNGVAPADGLGVAVAIDGDWAAIGDAHDGKVIIYHTDNGGTNWSLAQTITANATDPVDFGRALTLQGGELLVGAPGAANSEDAANLGLVVVFDLSGGAWQRTDSLPDPSAVPGDLFGWSLDRLDGLAVIGARGNYSQDNYHGKAFVFDRNASGTWNFVTMLRSANPSWEDGFSRSVATNGSDVLVGSSVDHSYVFRNSVLTWNELDISTPVARNPAGTGFGTNVAFPFPDTLLMSAPADSSAGAALGGSIYEYALGAQPEYVRRVDMGNSGDHDQFASAIDADGALLAIGTPYANSAPGADTGALSIYRLDSSSPTQLKELAKIVPPNVNAWDAFGYAVSVSDNRVAALSTYGFQIETGGTGQDGSVYLYRWDPATDAVIFEQRIANPTYGWGTTVALRGDLFAVGANGSINGSPGLGQVYLYRFDPSRAEWSLTQTLVAADSSVPGFGTVVTWCGDNLLIGAPSDSGGAAYLFSPQADGTFTQATQLTPSDSSVARFFGSAEACTPDGGTIAVGSSYGTLYLFESAAGAWQQTAELSVPQDNEVWLSDLHFHKHTLYVGVSPSADTSQTEQGSVHVFRNQSGSWQEVERIRAASTAPGDAFGARLAIMGNALVVQSSLKPSPPAIAVGMVNVFGNADDIFSDGFDDN